jgi:osmotically-inducible protein OsmY
VPRGKPRKAHPYLIPLSLAMIVAASLIPHPDAKPPATDDRVAKAVEEGRHWNRATPAESVTLHFDERGVRMGGVVPDMLVKQPEDGGSSRRAGPAASRALLRAIEAALVREHAVESGVVTVTAAKDGSVALTGDVRSPQEKRRAGEVAGGVRGVGFLDNRLSVTTAVEQPDSVIESDIRERLKLDAHLDASFIRVVAANGMVTLSGAVGTAAEKRRAVEDAWVAGVRHVEASRLTVKDWVKRFKPAADKWTAHADEKGKATLHSADLPAPPPAEIRNFLQ